MSARHLGRLAVGIAVLLFVASCGDSSSDSSSSTTRVEATTDLTTSTSVAIDDAKSLTEHGCIERDGAVTPTTRPTLEPAPASIDLPDGTDSPRELVLVDDHAIVVDLNLEVATNEDGSRATDGSMARSTLRVRRIAPDGSLSWSTDLGTAAQWSTDSPWPGLTFEDDHVRVLWPRLESALPAPTYGDVPWTLAATTMDLDGTITTSVDFPEASEASPDGDYPGSPRAVLGPDGAVVVGRPGADRFEVLAFDANGTATWRDELPLDTSTDSIGTSLVMTSAGPAAASGGAVVAWNPDGTRRWEVESKPAALAPLDVGPEGPHGSLALLYRAPGPLSGEDEAFEDYCIVDTDGRVTASTRIGWTGVAPRSGWWTGDTVTLFSTWVGLGTAQSLVRFNADGTAAAEEIPLGFSGDVIPSPYSFAADVERAPDGSFWVLGGRGDWSEDPALVTTPELTDERDILILNLEATAGNANFSSTN